MGSNNSKYIPVETDPLAGLPMDVRSMVMSGTNIYLDFLDLLEDYPKLKDRIEESVSIIYGTDGKILSFDRFMQYRSLTDSDFVIRVETLDQLLEVARRRYLRPRIVLSPNFVFQYASKHDAILQASIAFVFEYFRYNQFIITPHNVLDGSTRISIMAEEELLKYENFVKATHFGPSFCVSGGYGGSILYNFLFMNRRTSIRTAEDLKNVVPSRFSDFLNSLNYPIDLLDFYLKLFKYLGLPLSNLIIGYVGETGQYQNGPKYLQQNLTTNREVKTLSMAVPSGDPDDTFTILTTIATVERLPYIEAIGINLIEFTPLLQTIPKLFRVVTDQRISALKETSISKISLIYSEKDYDYFNLISKFPKLKEIVFLSFFHDKKNPIHTGYLKQFLDHGITIYLLSNPNDSMVEAVHKELNQRLHYPLLIGDTITPIGLNIPHQLNILVRKESSIYIES